MISRTILRSVLWAISQPRTFYVLGAGASFGIVPVTDAFGRLIADEVHSIGIYPTAPVEQDLLRKRIFRKTVSGEFTIPSFLVRHISRNAFEYIMERAMYAPRTLETPVQYAVFEILGRPGTLFNFNLDGLADLYCGNTHVVLKPHGEIDRPLFDNKKLDRELLEATLGLDLRVQHPRFKLLPSSEPARIVSTTPYLTARQLFRLAPAVMIVGYSFGAHDGYFDDAESYEYLADLLTLYPRPVFVLSPTPEELSEVLRQRLSSGCVFPVPVRWEVFAELLLKFAAVTGDSTLRWHDEWLDRFVLEYLRLENSPRKH